MAVLFITFFHIFLVPFFIIVYIAVYFVCFCLLFVNYIFLLLFMYTYCYVHSVLGILFQCVVLLPSQYIFSLLSFTIRNKNQFPVNSEIYHFDTRQHANFHQPSVNMTKFQKGVSNLGANVFNMLPSCIEIEFDNPKKFKMALQKFLYENYFNFWMNIFQSWKIKDK